MSASIRLRVGTDIRIDPDDYTTWAPTLTLTTANREIAVTILASFDGDDAVAGADRLADAVCQWRDGVRAAMATHTAAKAVA